MKTVMVMFDTLNRRFLPNYGCKWIKAPNFERLASHVCTFDNFYAGSMPCIPARRELHTGRYNFLHGSWSPMQPYDESIFVNLREAGVYSHITTDHFHYFEDGGTGYLSKFDSFEFVRGQQGDPWIPCVQKPYWPETYSNRTKGANWRHDWANRAVINNEESMPQRKTFDNGLRFLDDNHGVDNWYLQIESFDPHEPFFTQESWKKLYPHIYRGKQMDWPDYGRTIIDAETTAHLRYEYAALLSMCDYYLGKVMDKFDEYSLWKDTMLIVNTDHGFMLGEKGWMGKNCQPMYNELAHLPFFLHDPRNPESDGRRCNSLAQTIDIPVTLAEVFNAEPLRFAQGKSLIPALTNNTKLRDTALYGVFGGHVNITDGRYVYMKASKSAKNTPLFEYTLMPCHMRSSFLPDELQKTELSNGFSFTQGCKVMKIEAKERVDSYQYGDLLFDLKNDPCQKTPLKDEKLERCMAEKLRKAMAENDCPAEQYERIGIPKEGRIPDSTFTSKGEE